MSLCHLFGTRAASPMQACHVLSAQSSQCCRTTTLIAFSVTVDVEMPRAASTAPAGATRSGGDAKYVLPTRVM